MLWDINDAHENVTFIKFIETDIIIRAFFLMLDCILVGMNRY